MKLYAIICIYFLAIITNNCFAQTQTIGTLKNTVQVAGKFRTSDSLAVIVNGRFDSVMQMPADTLTWAPVGSKSFKNGKEYTKGLSGVWKESGGADSAIYATRYRLDSLVNRKADDTGVVHKAGTEIITGLKEFNQSPLVPTPSVADSSKRIVNSEYVLQAIYANVPKFQPKTLSLTGTGADTLTASQLVNMDITNLDRSGLRFKVINSGNPDSTGVKFNPVTGGLKFGVGTRSGEDIYITYQPPTALAAWSGGTGAVVVSAFAEVTAAAANPNYTGFIIVFASGNTGGYNPGYDGIYYVNKGAINQLASYPFTQSN